MLHRKIETTQGQLACLDSSGPGFPVLLIHGNSSCKEVFRQQFEGSLSGYRLIAFDLPGHGESDDARDPEWAYTVPGYADVAMQLLASFGIDRAVVFGWSLGGHIGLEMLGQGYDAGGLMIVGTPPLSGGIFGMLRGFRSQLDLLLATKSRLSARETDQFLNACLGPEADPLFRAMISRTDPRARPILARSMIAGSGCNQRRIAEQSAVPIAVVNGSREPFARLEYLAGLNYANLWDGQCHVIDGMGHAPFIEAPNVFNPLLSRFIRDIAEGRAIEPNAAPDARQLA